MSAVQTLIDLLAGRRDTATLTPREWDGVIGVARAETLLGTLAHRLADAAVPASVAMLFVDARAAAAVATTQALWEAEMARRALAPLGIDFVLLKGAAYAAAALSCSPGRQIGDLDILVARANLDAAEAALLAAGWEWVKTDAYDDAYYRNHMHELPPLIHKSRDRMIDVHHRILPLTHRVTPDAAAMLVRSVPLENDGHHVLGPADMLIHCAAHVIADGDLAGGLRNLWDFYQLAAVFGADWNAALELAMDQGLTGTLRRAFRLSMQLYGTPAERAVFTVTATDRLFLRALTARDDWGRATRPITRLAFTIRSHWMRMPPLMLMRHLWAKWRRR